MIGRRFLVILAALFCIAAAADPAERLPDPVLEARARAMFVQIRCVVCQNESIDDSEADIARDLRQTIRRQIAAGRSDAEVRGFLVRRYGEFILLRPRFSPENAALWLTPGPDRPGRGRRLRDEGAPRAGAKRRADRGGGSASGAAARRLNGQSPLHLRRDTKYVTETTQIGA